MRYDASNPFFKPAKKSAWPVQKLQEAGAVLVGKMAMHELGVDVSGCNVSSPKLGPYRHPPPFTPFPIQGAPHTRSPFMPDFHHR